MIPEGRANAAVVAVGRRALLSGGLSRDDVCRDAYMLDMVTEPAMWHLIDPIGDVPSARLSHAIAVSRKTLYMFGGHGENEEPLGDVHALTFQEPQLDVLSA